MDRAYLQDSIQSDLNKEAGTFMVEAVHCERWSGMPDADYLCVIVPSDGGKTIGIAVAVDGSDWREVGKPVTE